MKEKNAQSLFTKNILDIDSALCKAMNCVSSFAFELKISKSNCLSFDSIKAHQVTALLQAKTIGVYHKISDIMFKPKEGRFASPKPFDCFLLRDAISFVVIMWYVPRKRKEFHFIEITQFLDCIDISGRKSLTYEKSKEICQLNYKPHD